VFDVVGEVVYGAVLVEDLYECVGVNAQLLAGVHVVNKESDGASYLAANRGAAGDNAGTYVWDVHACEWV
jgi:hypothetical protein